MLKEEIRQLKKNCEDLKRNLSLSLVENEKKSKEDNQLKKDEMKIQTEKAQLIPQINQEEEDLKFKLKQAKTKMDAYFKNSSGLFHAYLNDNLNLHIFPVCSSLCPPVFLKINSTMSEGNNKIH